MSESFLPHGLQHARLSYPSLTPRAYSNSCPSSWWCHPTISSFSSASLPAFSLSQHQGLFKWVLHIRWPNYWSISFSVSPSNEYSRLIPFKMVWFDLLAVQGTQESSLTPQFKSISSLVLSFLYGSTLTSIRDYWKNHSFDYMYLW